MISVRVSRGQLLALLWTIGLALAACGGGTASTTSSLPSSSTTSTVAPAITSTTPPSTTPPATSASTTSALPATTLAPNTTAAPTTTKAATPGTATLAFVGDVIGLIPNIERARQNAGGEGYDFRPMFDRVRPLISAADYAICHFEVPVKPEGQGWTPRYVTPGELVTAVADAGFDRCSLASNHALDRGAKGIDATAAAFDAIGLGRSGTAVSEADAVPDLVEVNGIRIAHLSYTYATPGHEMPRGEPWRVNLINRKQIQRDIKTVRAAGAHYVVVSLHFGKTMITAPDDFQKKTVRWLWSNTDVDLIVGCHAHVIQPIDHRGDRYVLYGLGNHLATYPGGPITTLKAQDGLLAFVTIRRADDGSITTDRPSIIPTWDGRGDGSYTIYDARDAANPEVPADLRKQLEKSLRRTRAVVGEYLMATS